MCPVICKTFLLGSAVLVHFLICFGFVWRQSHLLKEISNGNKEGTIHNLNLHLCICLQLHEYRSKNTFLPMSMPRLIRCSYLCIICGTVLVDQGSGSQLIML